MRINKYMIICHTAGFLMSVTAYCPGHISGYFKRVIGKTPEPTGSIGAGIVIDPGCHGYGIGMRTPTTVSIRTGIARRENPDSSQTGPPHWNLPFPVLAWMLPLLPNAAFLSGQVLVSPLQPCLPPSPQSTSWRPWDGSP